MKKVKILFCAIFSVLSVTVIAAAAPMFHDGGLSGKTFDTPGNNFYPNVDVRGDHAKKYHGDHEVAGHHEQGDHAEEYYGDHEVAGHHKRGDHAEEYYGDHDHQKDSASVPEPGTLLLMGSGIVGFFFRKKIIK